MKKKKWIFLAIVLLVLLLVGGYFYKSYKENKNYENLAIKFLDALMNEEKMETFASKNINYKGVIASHKMESADDFLEEYNNVKLENDTKDELKNYLIDIAEEAHDNKTSYQVVNKYKPMKTKTLVTLKVDVKFKSENEENLTTLLFTFYKNKLVDIEGVTSNNKLESVFATYFIDIKNTGYYVYKAEDVWEYMQFKETGEASLLINFCPGQGCGGYSEAGTYKRKGRRLIVTMTTFMGDTDEGELDEPSVNVFKIVDADTIVFDNKYIFKYQEEFD